MTLNPRLLIQQTSQDLQEQCTHLQAKELASSEKFCAGNMPQALERAFLRIDEMLVDERYAKELKSLRAKSEEADGDDEPLLKETQELVRRPSGPLLSIESDRCWRPISVSSKMDRLLPGGNCLPCNGLRCCKDFALLRLLEHRQA